MEAKCLCCLLIYSSNTVPLWLNSVVGTITGPWTTAISSQFQEFSIDMLFKSGLSCRWAGDWRWSLSKHSLYSLAFSLSLTRGVCLSLRHIKTLSLSLLSLPFSCSHIQSFVETESRWEAGLSCQTSHQKATFYTFSMLSSRRGFVWAKSCSSALSVLAAGVCLPLWCRHRK